MLVKSSRERCFLLEKKSNYWPQLDGLRTIAFLLVLFHHHGTPAGLVAPVSAVLSKVSEWGWLGVDLFFILSAFLVTHLLCTERNMYGKISLPKFYARRALRIWPLYFLVLTVTCFVYPLFAPHKASHLYALFLQKIVLPLYTFTGNTALPWEFPVVVNFTKASGLEFMIFATVLGPFWSLCIEEQFYLLWGASARILNNMKKLMVFASLLLVVGFVGRFWLLSTNRELVSSTCYYMASLWHLDTIMMGALLAMLLIAKPDIAKPLRGGWLPPVMFVGCIATYFAVILCGPTIHSWSYWLPVMMTLVSLSGATFLALAMHWTPLTKVLSVRWLREVGKLTFGMYVFHFGITYLAKQTFHLGIMGVDGFISLGVCFLLTLGAALISWNVLEKPMNDMRRKLSRVHVEEPGSTTSKSPEPAKVPQGEKELAIK